MVANIKITKEDIINQVKISGQLPNLISQIIDRKLITSAISKLKITISDQELQVAADQFRELNNLHSAHETMVWLQDNSLTVDDFETIAESSISTKKLAQKLFSQSDIERHFFENRLDYSGLVMYEIILDSKDLAVEIFYAIQEDEITFNEAARKYISNPELRRSGGYSGIIDRASCLPQVSAVIATARAPQLLKPISTNRGTHLIFLEEIIDAQLTPETVDRILVHLFTQWLQANKGDVDIVRAI